MTVYHSCIYRATETRAHWAWRTMAAEREKEHMLRTQEEMYRTRAFYVKAREDWLSRADDAEHKLASMPFSVPRGSQ